MPLFAALLLLPLAAAAEDAPASQAQPAADTPVQAQPATEPAKQDQPEAGAADQSQPAAGAAAPAAQPGSDTQSTTGPAEPSAAQAPPANAATSPAAQPAAEEPAKPEENNGHSVEEIKPSQAEDILGKEIVSAKGEDMGRIVNVLVDQAGRPMAAVIDFGGFLGVGSRKLAVDWRALHFSPEKGDQPVILRLNRDQLAAAPEYKGPDQPVSIIGQPRPKPPAGTPSPVDTPPGQSPGASIDHSQPAQPAATPPVQDQKPASASEGSTPAQPQSPAATESGQGQSTAPVGEGVATPQSSTKPPAAVEPKQGQEQKAPPAGEATEPAAKEPAPATPPASSPPAAGGATSATPP